jgi:hypothetical protein
MANLKVITDTAANLYTRFRTLFPNTLPVEQPIAAPAATVTTTEGLKAIHTTRIDLAALAISLSDANVGGGTKIYDFPEGLIRIHSAAAIGITPTTTSAILTTLNGSKTLSVGVGSVQTTTQGSGTVSTTEQDVVNAFSATSSATINVAGTAGNGKCGAPQLLDGHTTAASLFLNVQVPTATDIDGDATITVSGVVIVDWSYVADY